MRLILRRFAWALVWSVVGHPALSRADPVDDQFAVAAGHYRQHRWQEACDEFARLLDEHADHSRAQAARFFYGEALAQLGRWEQARAQFGDLLLRDPDHRYARPALFRRGEAAYLAGDDPNAKRDLQSFRERFPNDDLNAYALAYLANLELRAENASAANKLFTTALEQFADGPLGAECRLGLAHSQQRLGQLDQARRGYAQTAEADGPLADQAMLQWAALDNSTGNHASALATLERMATKHADSPLQAERRLAQGYALFKLGRWNEAEALLGGLLDHPSLSVEAHYWLGLSECGRGAWREAGATLVAGGQIDPRHRLNPPLAFHAGEALARDGQLDAARRQFDRVLTQWPQATCADACLLGKLRIAVEQHEYADCVPLADQLVQQFPASPLVPRAQLAKGQSLLALGRFAEAVAPLEQLLDPKASAEQPLDGSRAEALAAMAICNARLGQFAKSEENLIALRAQRSASELTAETSCQVAEMAYRAGQPKLAGELFVALADNESSRDMACRGLSSLAWHHFEAGEWTQAADVCERLLGQNPDASLAAEAALLRGRSLEHLNQNDAALAMYRLIIDRHATSKHKAEALWRAARLHDSLHQPEQAIDLYARLVNEHPDFGELDAALYRWAWLLRESRRTDAAGELFARLRRDFPTSRYVADATLRLAEGATEAQKFDDAQSFLASITGPDAPPAIRQQALYLQGRARMLAGQWSAAEASLAQLVESFPQSELALPAAYLMAESAFQQGQFEQAVERLTDLATRTKDHGEPWSAMAELRRAQALAQMKEWEKALEIAEMIAKRFPDFDQQYEVDYLTGRALAATADFAGARQAYAKVIESPRASKTPTAAMAQWMIGESYFHQENYAAALSEYAKLDARHPFARWQAAALLQAGKCHELMGQWRLAAEDYDRLSKDYPSSEFSEEAAKRSGAAHERLAAATAKPK